MKKFWSSILTAAALLVGTTIGTSAHADGWHRGWDHHHGRDRWERCDDDRDDYRRGYPRAWGYRPYREVREVYYEPVPRYYRPAPVYYRGYERGYDRGYNSGIRGSISVNF